MVAVDTPQLIAISIIGLLFVSFAASETTNVSNVSPIPPSAPVVDDPVIGGENSGDGEDIDFNPNVTFAEGEIDLVENSELNITQDFTTYSDQHITPFNSTVDITSVQRNMPFTVVKYAADGDPIKATDFNSGNAGFTIADVSASPDNYLAKEGYLFQLYKNETQQANFYPVPRMTIFSIDSFTDGETGDWESNSLQNFKDTSEKLNGKVNTDCCDQAKTGYMYKNESIDSDKEAITLRMSTHTNGFDNSPDFRFIFGSSGGQSDYGRIHLDGDMSNRNFTIFYNENTGDIQVNRDDEETVGSTSVPTTLEDEEFYWGVEGRANDDDSGSFMNIHDYGVVPRFSRENWDGLTYVMPENKTVDVNGYDTSMTSTPEVRFSSDGGENFYAVPSRMEANNTVRFRHVGDPSNFEILVAQSNSQIEDSKKSLLSFLGGL